MDAVNESKIQFSIQEIDKIPAGLYGMYNLFFDRMLIQYGENNWNTNYILILKILLVSFEGIDANQLSFFTGIERNVIQKILINLKPFIAVERLVQDTSKSLRYKLYHQSLDEFLRKEY